MMPLSITAQAEEKLREIAVMPSQQLFGEFCRGGNEGIEGFIADQGQVIPMDERGEAYRPRKNKVTPLAELVGLGPAIVPWLCLHLEDKREISLALHRKDYYQGTVAYSYYDRWGGFPTRDPNGPFESPTLDYDWPLTLGDICFFALGQIVNRRFGALYMRVQEGPRLNAPSLFPSLTDQARSEWGKATVENVLTSLKRDLAKPDRLDRSLGALRRLRLFAPNVIEGPVLDRLSLPVTPDDRSFLDDETRYRTVKGISVDELHDLLIGLTDYPNKKIDEWARSRLKQLIKPHNEEHSPVDELARALFVRLLPGSKSDRQLALAYLASKKNDSDTMLAADEYRRRTSLPTPGGVFRT